MVGCGRTLAGPLGASSGPRPLGRLIGAGTLAGTAIRLKDLGVVDVVTLPWPRVQADKKTVRIKERVFDDVTGMGRHAIVVVAAGNVRL